MNTNTKQILYAILVFAMLFTVKATIAQSLTIKGKVLLENKSTLEPIEVKILDLKTNEIKDLNVIRSFNHVLPYNGEYLVIVSKEGFQPKSIYINTECNDNHPYKYQFIVDLKPKTIEDNIPIAVGGIYYNKKKDEFTYYLTN